MTKQNEQNKNEVSPTVRAPEAARMLNCNPRTVMRMCDKGVLVACKVGNQWRINRAALLEYVTKGTNQEKGAEQVA